MAISTPGTPFWTNDVDPFEATFNCTDIAIGGKLLQATLEVSATNQIKFLSDDDYKRAIKQKIAAELARVMIESNLIEFTHIKNVHDYSTTIHARCYLAPNDQVKLLRLHYANANKR